MGETTTMTPDTRHPRPKPPQRQAGEPHRSEGWRIYSDQTMTLHRPQRKQEAEWGGRHLSAESLHYLATKMKMRLPHSKSIRRRKSQGLGKHHSVVLQRYLGKKMTTTM